MPTSNASQNKFLEILIREMESLKKSSEQINQAYWKVEKILQQVDHRMDTYHVPVDIKPMQRESRHLEQVLKNRVIMPDWAWKLFLICLGVVILACGGFMLRMAYDYKQEAMFWKQQYEQIKQEQQPPDLKPEP